VRVRKPQLPRSRWLLAGAAVASGVVAMIFLFVGDAVPDSRGGWHGLVLSWCHDVAWVFVSAAFAVAASGRGPRLLPRVLGLTGLASYLLFRAVLHGLV